jgi:hypothetical protein
VSAVRRGTQLITPSSPAPLAGYASRGDACATGTGDELEATLVVWTRADGAALAWLTIDAVAVTARLRKALADAVHDGLGDPTATVLVCASHTHSAPQGWNGAIHPGLLGEPDVTMAGELVSRVRGLAARVGRGRATAVTPYWISDIVRGVGANRHHPDGPHDSTAGVLVLADSRTGTPEVIVVDFACHPTVLPATNLRWSADWPGAARSVARTAIEAAASLAGSPSEPSVAFLQGAAGDASPRFVRRSADFAEVARLGAIFGGAVTALSQRASRLSADEFRVWQRSMTLPTRVLPSPDVARAVVDQCLADRAAARPDPNDPETRRLQTRLEGARVQLALASGSPPAAVEMSVSIVSVDDTAWVHLPLELYASLGLQIKAESPFPNTRVIGYTDGYFGYMADRQAHAEGTYEALSSLFDADTSEAFTTDVVAELHHAHAHDH